MHFCGPLDILTDSTENVRITSDAKFVIVKYDFTGFLIHQAAGQNTVFCVFCVFCISMTLSNSFVLHSYFVFQLIL